MPSPARHIFSQGRKYNDLSALLLHNKNLSGLHAILDSLKSLTEPLEALMKLKWYSDQRRLRVKKYVKGYALDEIDQMDKEQRKAAGLPESSIDEDYKHVEPAKSAFLME